MGNRSAPLTWNSLSLFQSYARIDSKIVLLPLTLVVAGTLSGSEPVPVVVVVGLTRAWVVKDMDCFWLWFCFCFCFCLGGGGVD